MTVFWCIAIFAAAVESPARYDLKSAFQMAETASVSIQKAQAELEEARAHASVAMSNLFPVVNLVAKPATLKDNVFLGQAIFNGESYNVYEWS